jgi:hypothetical protein
MSLQSLIDKPKELLELIDSCLKPKKIEKDQFGEVFTPMSLINEMLDKLPIEVWNNPDLKWFDPASGMGNFPVAVYLKLIEGLKLQMPNDEQRKKHIIENMLYMGELNKKNCFITQQIFNMNNQYKLNMYEGDTLKLNTVDIWGIEKFDIVIGNPPYNKPKSLNYHHGGGRSLWDLFVTKALDYWVKDNGFLVFIHPPSWRKPQHYLWEILSKKQMQYIKQYSKNEGLKIFGCSTLIDYYILENKPIYKETIIDAQDAKRYNINIQEWDFLPSGVFDTVKNILGKNKVIYSSSIYETRRPNISKTKKENHNLPVVYNMTKKDGLGFVYSNEDKGHFKIPKIILSVSEFQYPYNDWEGDYGLSNNIFGLPITSKEEGNKIVEAINSDKFKEILKYTKWSTFQTDWRMFNYFRKDFWKEFIAEPLETEMFVEEVKPIVKIVKKIRILKPKTKTEEKI